MATGLIWTSQIRIKQMQEQRSCLSVLSIALVPCIGGLADCCFPQQRSSEDNERLREALRGQAALLRPFVKNRVHKLEKRIEKLHVVLLAGQKDHGPAGNGLHDYPLWQKRWALLLGGEEASEEEQVNLVGPPDKSLS
jgi:hypothetical protein